MMKKINLFLMFCLLITCQSIASDIVFKDIDGKVLSKSDLVGYSGTAKWEVISEKSVNQEAIELHNQGREYGKKGDYEKSLVFLRKANKSDPLWAYPVYDMAFTHLLMGNNSKALELYKNVNSMEPKGFFTTKTAIYTLEGEENGDFPEGLYYGYLSLEWMEPAQKEEAVKNLVKNVPSFAPGWKEAFRFVEDDKSALTAIEKGLATKPDKETYGILLVNKALILNRQDKTNEAIEILGQLALDKNSTLATEKLAKQTLTFILNDDSE